jgi:S-formylglutathione hydrolase FrmB
MEHTMQTRLKRGLVLMGLGCGLAAAGLFAVPAAQSQAAPEWVTPAVRAPHLVQRLFHSAAAKTDVSYHIYIPDSYEADPARRFPVIYWLHGHGGGVQALPQIVEYFDRAMRLGKIPPALVVFPNGMPESMWCNSKDGAVPMETVVIDELVPQVDAAWRTIPSRAGRLIEGFSMGGYGAARLGMKYPALFGAISLLGAGPMQREFHASVGPRNLAADRARILEQVYGGDQAYFQALNPWALAEQQADVLRGRTRLRIAVGDQDAMQGPNQDFAAHVLRLRIPHTFHLVPNVAHQPLRLLQALGDANWDFYRAVLSGTLSGNLTGDATSQQPGR